jgi:hypothetical protein
MEDGEILDKLRTLARDSRELDAKLRDTLHAIRHSDDVATKMAEISEKVRKVFELYTELVSSVDTG